MKYLLAIICSSACSAFAQTPENFGMDIFLDKALATTENPFFYSAGLREALSDLHDKRSSVEWYLRNQCALSNEEAFRTLKDFIESLAVGDSDQDKNDRFQAICCIRDYPCEDAYVFLERLLSDGTESDSWAAANVLAWQAISVPDRLGHLREIMDNIPTENWARQNVYETISGHLEYGYPATLLQKSLARFLLDRASDEMQLPDMLDKILLCEVPKWRSSPQRAANAQRMLREHPDNPTLTNFFTRVLADVHSQPAFAAATNHLWSVKLPGPQKTSSAQPGKSIDADPWADLLDDLPEKKRREPTEELLDIDF